MKFQLTQPVGEAAFMSVRNLCKASRGLFVRTIGGITHERSASAHGETALCFQYVVVRTEDLVA
jgi:hypothetical protein